jgi:methylamine dehydrogenase accessory protein MauD
VNAGWLAAFALLFLLVSIETVLTLALLRQVGVLSMRVRPLGPMEGDEEDTGPSADSVLEDVPLEAVQSEGEVYPLAEEMSVLLFVSPTCSICMDLLKPTAAAVRDYPDFAFFLVGDTSRERAAEYAQRMGTSLPYFVAPGVFETWGVKGTPFVAVVSKDRRIIKSGVVNTLEQLEMLLGAARTRHDMVNDADQAGERVAE